MPPAEVGVLDRAVAILDAWSGGARHASPPSFARPALAHDRAPAAHVHGGARSARVQSADAGYRLGPRLPQARRPCRSRSHRSATWRTRRWNGWRGDGRERAALRDRRSTSRICVDAVESSSELRTFVPIGEESAAEGGLGRQGVPGVRCCPSRAERQIERHALAHGRHADRRALAGRSPPCRRRGMGGQRRRTSGGRGVGERPVDGPLGATIAAVSVSGPTSRIRRADAKRYAPAVIAAATEIERALGYQA